MKKQTLYYTALLPLIAATLIACAWWSLHDNRALILRDQPLLQLSEAQKQAIRDLKGDITLEAYVRNNPRQRRGFADLVAPYKQLQPRLHLEYINPDSDPLRVQERDITREGQLYLTDGTHGERIDIASPQSLATALLNLGESSDSQILHLQGHGERAWRQDSSGNWRAAYERIHNAKTTVGDQDQNRVRDIPRSTTLLVIADPETIPQEHGSALQTYLARGGNLLYTTDTRHPYLPPWLATLTGLKLVEGSIIDPGAKNYGLNDPQMLIIDTLGDDRVSDGISQAPLLPTAVAIAEDPDHPPTSDWKRTALLWTNNQSWAEHTPDAAAVLPDANEAKGPLALGWLLPLAWAVDTSFKTEVQAQSLPLRWLPDGGFTLENYRIVFSRGEVFTWMWNTLLVACLVTALTVVICALAGYAFSRTVFKGRRLLFAATIALIMVPGQILIVPLFKEMVLLRAVDTFAGIILPQTIAPMMVYIFKQYFDQVPQEIEDAARVDGAGNWRLFWNVILPISRPIVTAVAIFVFIGAWNNFMWPFIITNNPDLMTLPVGLSTVKNAYGVIYAQTMAAAVIAALPLTILFMLFQRQIIKAVATTGLGGQ